MKRIGFKRLLALLVCAVMVSGIGFPTLAEEAEAVPCPHGSVVTREEAGKAASCTSDGSHAMVTVCADCGKELSRVTVTDAALGHDFRESARTEAACEQAGSVTYACSRCGESYTQELPAPGHSYEKTVAEPTCTESGKTVYTCSVCGNSYTEDGEAALGHDYQETGRTEATYDAEGSVTYTCSRCGDSYTKELPKPEKPEEPFEQSETVNGVKVTVTAAAGVFAREANITAGGGDAFTRAAESVLGIEAGEGVIIRHMVYSFAGSGMNGEARVKMERLGLSEYRNAHPGSEVSVYVLRYNAGTRRTEEMARRVSADTDVGGDRVSFMLTEPGMYDVLIVVRLPEKAEEPAGENPGEPAADGKPAESEEPGADGEPAESEGPAAEGEPAESEEPGADGAPAESEEPAADGAPAESEEPGADGEPAESEEPGGEDQGEPENEDGDEPANEPQEDPASEVQNETADDG